MKKRMIAPVFLLLLIVGAFTLMASAADIVDSSNCGADGDNLRWVLTSDYTLNISGIGGMANYKDGNTQIMADTGSLPTNQTPYAHLTADETAHIQHVYKLFETGMLWEDARQYCESLGGHLMTVTSQEEQDILDRLLQDGTRNSYWIGGYQVTGDTYAWVTGENFSYTHWAAYQPDHANDNEDKLMAYRNDNTAPNQLGQWNDLLHDGTCGTQLFFGLNNVGFICEWEGATLVQHAKVEISTQNIKHIYQSYETGMTWEDARQYCESFGGHLMTVTSQEEQDILDRLLRTGDRNSYWLGGYQVTGDTYAWVTEEDFSYTHWATYQPDHANGNEDKLMAYRNDNTAPNQLGQWNDLLHDGTCGTQSFFGLDNFGFVCEWEGVVIITDGQEIKSYTITFDANGGTGTPSPQTKEENVPLTLNSLKPSKTYVLQYNANGGSVSPASKNVSCSFNNWNTEKNGGGTSYASGDSYTTNADATLYAQWTNPSAGALATPSRSGYDFIGWFTSVTGGVQITESSTVSENMTLYANWIEQEDPYNMGDETYSFENYGDSDSFGGHCFGMSITSAGYHNNLLDIGRIGGNANTPLYSFSRTQTVKQPICYYQSIQGSYSVHAIVAGGSFYLDRGYNIASDWQEVVKYVRTHDYDSTGALQIGFRKKDEGGHAINFLRYENVDGQERIYAYDNNFPNQETYFYQDSSGRVWQTPVQTFSGAIDCIALRDCRIYFNSVGDFDATHVLYMAKDAATVQGYTYSYMEGIFSGEEYVMYEIPANQVGVIIIPNRDYADFIYMDTEYSFGKITNETRGELKFVSLHEGAVSSDASFRIFEDEPVTPTVSITLLETTLHYEIVNFDIDKMLLFIADYDASGKMLRVQQVSPLKQAGDISVEEAANHRAFLLDRTTFAPLCAKASIP